MLRNAISITVIMMLMAASAQAAHLANVTGTVLINRGDGFRPIAGGVEVSPGDRIRAGAGSADIVYDNGCAAPVGPGEVVVVLLTPPACKGARDGFSAFAGPSPETLIIGGLTIAGGAGLAVALSEGTSHPASP